MPEIRIRRVLSECFLGIPRKSAPESARKIGSAPRECSRECLSSFFPKKKALSEHSPGHSQFSGHSPGHFLGIPKKHSESTRRSTFGDSPNCTPVNGRQDRNSGGSNSPWSEFWSEFPHFMGMGVVFRQRWHFPVFCLPQEAFKVIFETYKGYTNF